MTGQCAARRTFISGVRASAIPSPAADRAAPAASRAGCGDPQCVPEAGRGNDIPVWFCFEPAVEYAVGGPLLSARRVNIFLPLAIGLGLSACFRALMSGRNVTLSPPRKPPMLVGVNYELISLFVVPECGRTPLARLPKRDGVARKLKFLRNPSSLCAGDQGIGDWRPPRRSIANFTASYRQVSQNVQLSASFCIRRGGFRALRPFTHRTRLHFNHSRFSSQYLPGGNNFRVESESLFRRWRTLRGNRRCGGTSRKMIYGVQWQVMFAVSGALSGNSAGPARKEAAG